MFLMNIIASLSDQEGVVGRNVHDYQAEQDEGVAIAARSLRKLSMLGQDLCEAPDFMESVVERRGRDADHVWLTEIAFYVGGDKLVVQLLRMFVRQDR
jgi:hypothetical protein